MKRNLWIIIALCLVLTGCCTSHEWTEADCVSPRTCVNCGQTEGAALGHHWVEADCTASQTCANCGQTVGSPLGHHWAEASCAAPKTCLLCGETEGEVQHSPLESGLYHKEGKPVYAEYCPDCGFENATQYDDWRTLLLEHAAEYRLYSVTEPSGYILIEGSERRGTLTLSEDGSFVMEFYEGTEGGVYKEGTWQVLGFEQETPLSLIFQTETGYFQGYFIIFEDVPFPITLYTTFDMGIIWIWNLTGAETG